MNIEDHCGNGAITLNQLMDRERNCRGNNWDRTFEFEGNLYALLDMRDGRTHYTRLTCDTAYVAFNLKSRTIRGLSGDTQVIPRRCSIIKREHHV